MNLKQMITYHTNMIKAEASQTVISGYFMGILARNLEAVQQLKSLLGNKIYTKESKFKHDYKVTCINPVTFKLLAQNAAKLEGHPDIIFTGDLDKADCFVYQNNLGIRWSNNPSDYTSIPNTGLPWNEIHANIRKTANDIKEELREEKEKENS